MLMRSPRRFITIAALVLVGIALAIGSNVVPEHFLPRATDEAHAAPSQQTYSPGRLIVGLKKGLTVQSVSQMSTNILSVTDLPGLDVAILDVTPGTEDETLKALENSGAFRYVERDALIPFPEPVQMRPLSTSLLPSIAPQAVPNDVFYALQWALPKIGAEQAWEFTSGSSTIKVAVLDSGFDVAHPDRPTGLIQGPDYMAGGSVQIDDVGHGTHVAGIIAAAMNNATGVAGLAPNVELVVVRVGDKVGVPTINLIQGLYWAADNGARVINLSLGGTSDDPGMRDAIAYAVGRGVVVVAASGNCAEIRPGCPTANPVQYPAAYPGVIAVGATNFDDEVAWFSGHRDYVSVSAPGELVLSTYLVSYGGYAFLDGTSMAAPHVSALAALLLSVNPSLSAAQVKSIIESTAVDLGTPGKDDYFGWGRINACKAVIAVLPLPTVPSGHKLYLPSVMSDVRTPCS